MSAPKRKNRSQWPSKYRFRTSRGKHLKIPLDLLKQIGGRRKLRRKSKKHQKRQKFIALNIKNHKISKNRVTKHQ